MKNLLIIGLVFLAACTKTIDKPLLPIKDGEKIRCDFGMEEFNLVKRPPVVQGGMSPTGSVGARSLTDDGVVYLDFDGQLVTNTAWNYAGDINCSSANLTASEISAIVERVSNDYSPFNIVVTTSETVFNAAPANKKIRVIITESWEWYGLAGGTAIVNSFTWGNDTPCFIFSSLLNYSTKKIAEAVSHEAGHTLGLHHQAVYDANCVKISEYNDGQGSGETGWAPIMGVGYNKNLTLWHKGPNAESCTTIQDDAAQIAAIVGYKPDDYPNSSANAPNLTSSLDGMISDSSDIDFFAVSTNDYRKIYLTPFNVGINDAGANVDLIVRVYNSQGILISTTEKPDVLYVETSVAPGNYYISVGTTSNQFTTNFGMRGKYNISIQ